MRMRPPQTRGHPVWDKHLVRKALILRPHPEGPRSPPHPSRPTPACCYTSKPGLRWPAAKPRNVPAGRAIPGANDRAQTVSEMGVGAGGGAARPAQSHARTGHRDAGTV